MGSFRLAAGRLHHHKHFNFAESREETVWPSLRHSCRSELTRQGISLSCPLPFPEELDSILAVLDSSGSRSGGSVRCLHASGEHPFPSAEECRGTSESPRSS